MFGIRRKIIAIAIICAMSISMTACSDSGKNSNSSANKIQKATITPEQAEQLREVEFSVVDFTPAEDAQQDPVEQDSSSDSNSDSSNSRSPQSDSDQSSAVSNDDNNNSPNSNNNSSSGSNDNSSSGSSDNNNKPNKPTNSNNNTPANNNNNTPPTNNNNEATDSNNNSENNNNNAVITGTKDIKQGFWMNLNGDYVFDGEYAVLNFKIKETTADGTYPIIIEWLDFSNIDSVSFKPTGINGAVVVGSGEATESQFKNDGSFEVKADNVVGNPGDDVKVSIRFKNNPGICATLFRFSYDSDALEYVKESMGSDFKEALKTQNKNN